jgi:hypothetical protein
LTGTESANAVEKDTDGLTIHISLTAAGRIRHSKQGRRPGKDTKMTYYYDRHQLTAKTDDGARRQARKLIRDGKARGDLNMEFYRESDGCHGWFEL